MISLIGLPPTVGFFSKAYIFNVAIDSELTWLMIIGVINTAISSYYYLKIVKILYLEEPSENISISINLNQKIVVISILAGLIIFGVFIKCLLPSYESKYKSTVYNLSSSVTLLVANSNVSYKS
mgnify:CR=1 FL=1